MSIDVFGALRLKRKTKKSTYPRKYVTNYVQHNGRPVYPYPSKNDHLKDYYPYPIGK